MEKRGSAPNRKRMIHRNQREMKWRMKRIYILLPALAAAFLTACTPQKDGKTGDTARAEEPKDIYMQHCANCHGGNLEGSYGPSLKGVGSRYSKDQILAIIRKGKGKMPSQDYVDKSQQEKLADWLSQTQKQ
jgi:cytochrome c551